MYLHNWITIRPAIKLPIIARPIPIQRVILLMLILIATGNIIGCGGAEQRKAKYLQRGQEYFNAGNLEKAKIEFKNVLQIDPKDAPGNFYMGRVEEAEGNVRRAFAFYTKAYDQDSNLVDAILKLARIYTQFDLDKAIQLNNEALKLQPDNPDAAINQALIFTKQDDETKAIDILRKTVDKNPENYEVALALSVLYEKRGDDPSKQEVLTRAIEEVPANIPLRAALGNHLYKNKDYSGAERHFREIVTLNPNLSKYRLALAKFYVATKQTDKAEVVLRKSVDADPEDENRYLHLAAYLLKFKGAEQAILELKSYITAHPDLETLPFTLANINREANRLSEAESLYRDLIDQHKFEPLGIRARNELALLLLQQDKTQAAIKYFDEVLEENPKDNQALYWKGRIALSNKNADEAISLFRQVLRDQPDNAELHGTLANALLVNGKEELAREHLEKSITLNGKNTRRRLQLAQLLAKTNNIDAALKQLEIVQQLSPDDLKALQIRTAIQAHQGDMAAAEETLKQIKSQHSDIVAADISLGRLYFGQENFKAAVNEFESALTKQPDSAYALAGVVNALLAQKAPDLDLAEQRMEQFIKGNPTDPNARAMLGRFLLKLERYSEAIHQLQVAVNEQPDFADAMNLLVAGYEKLGELDKALSYLQGLLENNPKHPLAHAYIGLIHAKEKRFGQAETALLTATDVNKNWGPAYDWLAGIYLTQNDTAKALETYEQGLKAAPNDVNIPIKLANLYYRYEKKYDQAIALYETVLEKFPAHIIAKNDLAALLSDHGEGSESLQKALSLVKDFKDSENPAFLDTLGWVYYKLDNFEQAFPLLKKALEKSPNEAIFNYHLGMLHYKQGNTDDAKKYLTLALQQKPSFPGADEAEQLLQSL